MRLNFIDSSGNEIIPEYFICYDPSTGGYCTYNVWHNNIFKIGYTDNINFEDITNPGFMLEANIDNPNDIIARLVLSDCTSRKIYLDAGTMLLSFEENGVLDNVYTQSSFNVYDRITTAACQYYASSNLFQVRLGGAYPGSIELQVIKSGIPTIVDSYLTLINNLNNNINLNTSDMRLDFKTSDVLYTSYAKDYFEVLNSTNTKYISYHSDIVDHNILKIGYKDIDGIYIAADITGTSTKYPYLILSNSPNKIELDGLSNSLIITKLPDIGIYASDYFKLYNTDNKKYIEYGLQSFDSDIRDNVLKIGYSDKIDSGITAKVSKSADNIITSFITLSDGSNRNISLDTSTMELNFKEGNKFAIYGKYYFNLYNSNNKIYCSYYSSNNEFKIGDVTYNRPSFSIDTTRYNDSSNIGSVLTLRDVGKKKMSIDGINKRILLNDDNVDELQSTVFASSYFITRYSGTNTYCSYNYNNNNTLIVNSTLGDYAALGCVEDESGIVSFLELYDKKRKKLIRIDTRHTRIIIEEDETSGDVPPPPPPDSGPIAGIYFMDSNNFRYMQCNLAANNVGLHIGIQPIYFTNLIKVPPQSAGSRQFEIIATPFSNVLDLETFCRGAEMEINGGYIKASHKSGTQEFTQYIYAEGLIELEVNSFPTNFGSYPDIGIIGETTRGWTYQPMETGLISFAVGENDEAFLIYYNNGNKYIYQFWQAD